MQAVESREECVGVVDDVLMVVFDDASQEFMLGVRYRLDDETIVARKVEERAGFAWRAEL